MKRYGNLWDEVCSFENLLLAGHKAARRKRMRGSTLKFNFNLEREIGALQRELEDRSYSPGPYREFYIYEPKKRKISAAPYRDRVAHHAVCNVIEPLFDRTFISDSYACRKGKGTHAAVDRLTKLCRQYRYVLKCDIVKFFPSIDHDILLSLIERKIKDRDVLWMLKKIIDSGGGEIHKATFPGDDLFTPTERRTGLPIGNLTSQLFANVYLNPLDRFVKEQLRFRAYIRYADDFLLLADDKKRLHEAKRRIGDFLVRLRLKLHSQKTVVFPAKDGIDFLGYRVFATHRRLRRQNITRFRRRMRQMQQDYREGTISIIDVRQSIQSWLGHARHADTYRLRAKLFKELVFAKG